MPIYNGVVCLITGGIAEFCLICHHWQGFLLFYALCCLTKSTEFNKEIDFNSVLVQLFILYDYSTKQTI